jgi:hypothetical protein
MAPLSSRGSLWLQVPKEIREYILNHCDPLTQYLNNHGPYANLKKFTSETPHVSYPRLSADHDRALWDTILDLEWEEGDLTKIYRYHGPSVEAIKRIKSRSMYERLSELGFHHKKDEMREFMNTVAWIGFDQCTPSTTMVGRCGSAVGCGCAGVGL